MIGYPQRITDRHVSHALNRIVDAINALSGQTAELQTNVQAIPPAASAPFIAGPGVQFIGGDGGIAVSNTGVTSVNSGTGTSVNRTTGDVTVTNTGVLSLTGTANQITVSATTGNVTLSTPQNIDTGAAVQCGQLNIAAGKLTVNSSGLPTKSNNVTLVGQGYALIVAQGSATGQTGAVASVASYTTTAAGGSFEIGGYIDVTAFTAGTLSLQCDYTDPAGTARTLVIPLVALAGTISTTVGAATDAQAVVVCIQTSGANLVKIYTTVTVFTGTYSVFGWIKQIA